MVASFFDQLLPVLEVEGSILVELYTHGAECRDRPTSGEVRLPPPSPGYLVSGQDPCRGKRLAVRAESDEPREAHLQGSSRQIHVVEPSKALHPPLCHPYTILSDG
jgi:hypothetical protein